MVVLWLLLASLPACGTVRKCNGAKEFCELSIHQYSFGGTHNSGAFSLSTPESLSASLFGVSLNFLGPDQITNCWYDNHQYSYQQQLNVGVRLFSPDFCMADSGEIKDCHKGSSDQKEVAWGTTLKHTIQTFFDWLNNNPDEIVMFRPEDLLRVDRSSVEAQIAGIFGDCFHMNLNLSAKLQNAPGNKVKCVKFMRDVSIARHPDQKKLQFLVENNLRFVYTDGAYSGMHTRSYYTTWESSDDLEKFINSQEAFVDGLEAANGSEPWAMIELDVFRTAQPEKLSIGCNDHQDMETNQALLKHDDDSRDYDPPDGTKCEKFACAGYQSRLEVMNLKILRKGYTLSAVCIDAPRHGHLSQTMRRINMANYRSIKGLPEPGLEWYEIPLYVFLWIGLPSLLIFSSCASVAFFRRKCCPSCIRESCIFQYICCERRARRRAEKEQRRLEAVHARVYAKAGGGAFATNQYPTGGYQGYSSYTGYGQTPPAGVYGQPKFQSGPNFPPQQPQDNYNQSAPGFYGPPQLQSGPNLLSQQLQQYNGQSSPVGVYGQPPWQSGPHFSPQQPHPYHGSPMTCTAGLHWPAAPASGNIASDFGISRPMQLRRGVSMKPNSFERSFLIESIPQPQGPSSISPPAC